MAGAGVHDLKLYLGSVFGSTGSIGVGSRLGAEDQKVCVTSIHTWALLVNLVQLAVGPVALLVSWVNLVHLSVQGGGTWDSLNYKLALLHQFST